MTVEDQEDIIAFLSRPEAFGRGKTVERIDTHISVVFLTGDRAYKLKRAVHLPYLDYTTLEQRRRLCHAEVRINRRTAPDLYLGVSAVVRRPDGTLSLGGDGTAVDWLVEMEQFDQSTLFDRLARAGRLDRFAMEDLADAVARFHVGAERIYDAGGVDVVNMVIESNTRCFGEAPEGTVDQDVVQALDVASRRVAARFEAVLEQRRRDGFVRHCHGDLHLGNIFLHHGQATLFDAIEFNAEFSNIDVLYDLAFVVMDLEHQGLPRLASILLNRYVDVTGDTGGLGALPLFLSLRAAVRSHVNAMAAGTQTDARKAAEARRQAVRYLKEATAFLGHVEPRLIAVGGLSGSGKSRLSRDLAPHVGPPPGARIVRTDSTRKRLAGVALQTRLTQSAYGPDMTRRTYEAVYDECRTVLASGRPVIADAVFAEPEEREAIAAVAREAGVPFHGLWLEAPADIMQERVTRRRRNVSDATPWIVRLQLSFDVGDIRWQRIDTSGAREASLAAAMNGLGLL